MRDVYTTYIGGVEDKYGAKNIIRSSSLHLKAN